MFPNKTISYYKGLAACRSAVLIKDGLTPNGTPIFVVRRIVECCMLRVLIENALCLRLDKALRDGCTLVLPEHVLGVYNGGSQVNVLLVEKNLEEYPYLTEWQKVMLIDDAKIRLREAYK